MIFEPVVESRLSSISRYRIVFRSFVRSIVDDYKRKRGEDLRKRVERTEFDEVVNVTQRERERGYGRGGDR